MGLRCVQSSGREDVQSSLPSVRRTPLLALVNSVSIGANCLHYYSGTSDALHAKTVCTTEAFAYCGHLEYDEATMQVNSRGRVNEH